MNTSNFEWPVDKKPLYSLLSLSLRGLIDGIPHQISNLANASALLGDALLNINWVGFYLMREGKLVLGPFQGKPACIEIEIGKGVCGTAVANDQVMLVKDVHQFPGHIACDSASNSEILIPLHKGNEIVGVLDIDSPVLARFDEEDQEGLEHFVRILESIFDRKALLPDSLRSPQLHIHVTFPPDAGENPLFPPAYPGVLKIHKSFQSVMAHYAPDYYHILTKLPILSA